MDRNKLSSKQPLTPAQQARKLVNTIKDWSWKTNQPSPQTGKFYPAVKAYHDGRTEIKIGEMLDENGKVLPKWQTDFNSSVIQWLNDMVNTLNPNINKLKDTLNLKDDINQENQQQFKQAINIIASQLIPQQTTQVAQTTPTVPAAVEPGVGTYANYVQQNKLY